MAKGLSKEHTNPTAWTMKTEIKIQTIGTAAEIVLGSADKEVQWLTSRKNPNENVRTVASLLGHAQASTTLDIYAHAFDKNKRKAQEKLGKAIGL